MKGVIFLNLLWVFFSIFPQYLPDWMSPWFCIAPERASWKFIFGEDTDFGIYAIKVQCRMELWDRVHQISRTHRCQVRWDVVNFASTTAGQSMSAPLICRDAILKNVFCLTQCSFYIVSLNWLIKWQQIFNKYACNSS